MFCDLNDDDKTFDQQKANAVFLSKQLPQNLKTYWHKLHAEKTNFGI